MTKLEYSMRTEGGTEDSNTSIWIDPYKRRDRSFWWGKRSRPMGPLSGQDALLKFYGRLNDIVSTLGNYSLDDIDGAKQIADRKEISCAHTGGGESPNLSNSSFCSLGPNSDGIPYKNGVEQRNSQGDKLSESSKLSSSPNRKSESFSSVECTPDARKEASPMRIMKPLSTQLKVKEFSSSSHWILAAKFNESLGENLSRFRSEVEAILSEHPEGLLFPLQLMDEYYQKFGRRITKIVEDFSFEALYHWLCCFSSLNTSRLIF